MNGYMSNTATILRTVLSTNNIHVFLLMLISSVHALLVNIYVLVANGLIMLCLTLSTFFEIFSGRIACESNEND
jgi:uncharacterized membrane protein SpoIIM required for sporulation